MNNFSVSKRFTWHGRITKKVAAVMRMFGLSVERIAECSVTHSCQLEINDGDVVYITGPSGSGKSVLLSELEGSVPVSERINVDEIELPGGRAVIDCVGGDFLAGLKLLSTAGLNDVFCVLNSPANLSDGQKWRFRMAMALASGKKFIFADEFCSNLDRITAMVISHNVHKFAKRHGVTFVLASSHRDTLLDLAADVVVVKELSGASEVIYKGFCKPRNSVK